MQVLTIASTFPNFVLCVALTSLALQLDSKTAKTSFGRLPLSDEKSNPVFGFTQAKREENQKLYLGDVTK